MYQVLNDALFISLEYEGTDYEEAKAVYERLTACKYANPVICKDGKEINI